jgi:hypothetical protein
MIYKNILQGFNMSEQIKFYPIIKGLELIEPIKLSSEANKFTNLVPEEFSLRTCPAIRDIMGIGYIVPLWQDLVIRYDDHNGMEVIPSGDMYDHENTVFNDVHFHHNHTFAGYEFGDEYVSFSMKLRCPWYVQTEKNTSIMVLPVQYGGNTHFTVASGIIESSKYPMLLAQIIFKKFYGEILLKKGTPLMQIIAIKQQPELCIYNTDKPIQKTLSVLKNWLNSKMHTAAQYRNIDKIIK